MTVSKKVKELKSIIEIYVILFHNIYIYMTLLHWVKKISFQ